MAMRSSRWLLWKNAALCCLLSLAVLVSLWRMIRHEKSPQKTAQVIFVPVSPFIEKQLAHDESQASDCTRLTHLSSEQVVPADLVATANENAQAVLDDLTRLLEQRRIALAPDHLNALRELLNTLQDQQQKLLMLRNRRHGLNIALMQAGVSLSRDLTDQQMDYILSNRDLITWQLVDQNFWQQLNHRIANLVGADRK